MLKGDLQARCEEFGRCWEGEIKEMLRRIGPGVEYNNGFAKVLISKNGGYCQLIDVPWEFSSWLSSEGPAHTFVDTKTAWDIYRAIMENLEMLTTENTCHFDLLVIYNRNLTEENAVFAYQYLVNEGVADIDSFGKLQPENLPVFLKLKAESELLAPFCHNKIGILIMIPYLTDQHMTIAWSFDEKANLSREEINPTVH
ncbi:hypothetical protein A2V71_00655 [Candidatus Berkelbacteria bacterium RBG_13_40_8]|uniref:Uncharacterized protein n=1 Tax=Candidatus Berkelbacteria bacterium RBG_13_40_8 TaxID=1797467 RepID=A0A1F5DQM3_9BACT|nr:MAG: hypothetical protein A2V71_00655 [Candidatus Berkelbacteria bacterium RBG_13_40_8]